MNRTQITLELGTRQLMATTPIYVSRRRILVAMAGLVVPPRFARERRTDASRALGALESRANGRLGVCVLDTRSGDVVGHRMDERFAMCSTFKLPLFDSARRSAGMRDADQAVLAEVGRIAATWATA